MGQNCKCTSLVRAKKLIIKFPCAIYTQQDETKTISKGILHNQIQVCLHAWSSTKQ